MKKTQWIELFRRIKETLVSFIAILFFVCFGIALFTGIKWSGSAVEDIFENEFNSYKLYDFEVVSNFAFTDNCIDELSNKFSEYEIEGGYSCFKFFNFNNTKLQTKIVSITDHTNQLFSIEGKIPEFDNEILVGKRWAKKYDIKIGDCIELEDNSIPLLVNNSFKVVGYCESPAYISKLAPTYEVSTNNGSKTHCIMFVNEKAFNDVILHGYNEIFVKCPEISSYKTLSDDYLNELNRISNNFNEELSKICDTNTNIVKRTDNGSIFVERILTDLFSKLKYNFALMFIIIGFMICFSTISRLVYIDTKRIGTKKALGLYDKEIIKNYLFYILFDTTLGFILGILISRFAIQPFFINILSGTFILDPVLYCFSIKEALVIFVIELSIMLLICYFACKNTLRIKTVNLLQGDIDTDSRINLFSNLKLLNKLPLLTKSILNNFINDKRRVVATLIGIVGSTALLVCALSFELSITGTKTRQFDLQQFTSIVSYDSTNKDVEKDIENYLNKGNYLYEKALLNNVTLIQDEGNSIISKLIVADNDDFNGIIKFYEDGKEIIPNNEAWISLGYAEEYGYKVGDYIKLKDSNSNIYDLKIGGIFEFYQNLPYVILSKDYYKDVFNKEIVYDSYLVNYKDNFNQFSKDIDKISGVIDVRDEYSSYSETQSIILIVSTAIVAIYILLSFIIALFVILDLFFMFIEEKKKELIVLMINGYSTKDSKKYIYLDTIFLSIIGIILGSIFGVLMNNWTINSVSSDMSYFIHGINVNGCLIGCLISTLLITIMCLISLHKINKFKLSDINK